MKKYGKGISTIMFGFGYGEGFPDHSIASVEIEAGGTILVKTAAADVGQGVLTVVAQITAEVLKVSPDIIKVSQGDTHLTKNAGSTSATRQTFFTGNAVKEAAEELLSKIYHHASLEFRSNHPEMGVENGYIFRHDKPNNKISYWDLANKVKDKGEELKAEASYFPKTYEPDPATGQAKKVYVAYTFMTQEIEVEVDTTTGEVEVLNVNTAIDLGKAINPKGAEGQIEGGTVQGVGMALMEEQVIKEGITFNPDLSGYVIPTAMDSPNFKSRLVEDEDSDGPFGAKGIGEPTTIGAAPAIANAIYDAIGIRFYQLPITPDRVKKALKKRG
ncbi:aerobic-type carbon monoxide dehydrogenase, large subunit CoxL/CutL-like protein [Halobacteroides halobius DSM 5150]|uniref:Aerobic-type carbon monoxide dehydrogenase, large subunit CoxL/CutL-like protein n=1 Tax=Halobacteroides halobius (strain ATCC 35273 / DSM 5150 / MD-1) TaxID=748449 RepID=L0K6W5_HALHC|nr:molybdopterin cofactor-binding domain-containing protein [Halobacteroides halobius]AGB41012.1 aerobic-type carbon monoxide dehydrogenase, large subunit CoxL/CutL-like protein [Halobacteroides halobius DSM 5150]